MNLAPAGVALPFEVTYDRGDLNVAMSVYDVTTGTPDLVQGPDGMLNISDTNTYFGTFAGLAGKTYVIIKAVYTDDNYTDFDNEYAQGSDSITVQDLAGAGGGGFNLVGYVSCSPDGCGDKLFTIFNGDDGVMYMKVIYAENGDPVDLTNCTEIDVALQKADGTTAHLLLTESDVSIATPKILGKFSAVVDSEVSLLLNPGVLQSFDVTFTILSKKMTIRYFNALSVLERD